MKLCSNNEGNNESYDSYASDDTSDSDFNFDYDELADNFDEFELFDEDRSICRETKSNE